MFRPSSIFLICNTTYIVSFSKSNGIYPIEITRLEDQQFNRQNDCLAVEEPLEITLGLGPKERRQYHNLAVTMRTPVHDFDLVVGFLITEGIILSYKDIAQIRYVTQNLGEEAQYNSILVELRTGINLDLAQLQRHFYTTSSCGVCGKSSLEMVHQNIPYTSKHEKLVFPLEKLWGLDKQLEKAQSVFAQTGGIHAVGLFDQNGTLVASREDVGRHNAMDKLIGAMAKADLLPLHHHLVLLSGRISFELVQKALMGGITAIAAVGAPSSLAYELAREFDIILIGFLRNGQMNIYHGEDRLIRA